MVKFFVRYQVIICLVLEFILINIVAFHVLLLCINKMSVFMMIFHMMNIFIWVFKADLVCCWIRSRDFCLRRDFFLYVSFFQVLWSWSMFVIVLKEFFYGWLWIYVNGPMKGKILVCHHVSWAVISLLCFWVHIQEIFLSGMGLKMFYVFGSIWVDIVDYDIYAVVVYQCIYAGTVV